MRLISKHAFFAALFSLILWQGAMGQVATSVNPSTTGVRQYAKDTVYSVKNIREDDKMYQISVWRRIDLREKYNMPLYGSGVTKENGLINYIYKAVKSNGLTAYRDENFKTPLSITEFDSAFAYNDNKDTVFVKNYYYLDFKEDFLFDRQHSQFKFDIKHVIITRPAEFNQSAYEGTVAYIRYKDFINYFANHADARWLNFTNISKSLTYSEAFESRLFRSVVRRYTNQADALVLDLINKNTPEERKKMQAYLDALAFEYKLLDFENSVWEW